MSASEQVISELRALGTGVGAAHNSARVVLGVPAASLDARARDLRQTLPLAERCALAQALWSSDIHEAGIFAAKLLTQARLRPKDGPVWRIIADWAQSFDDAARADAVCVAGAKRLQADPARLEEVAGWTSHDNPWTRRATLGMTLPWTRLPHPKAQDLAVIDRVLSWMEVFVPERTPPMQQAIGAWLRELSRRDPARVTVFLDGPGAGLTKGARADARRFIQP